MNQAKTAMAIAQYSEDDRCVYEALPPSRRDKVLGSRLSLLIRDGDATVSIVAKLDVAMRDYIIRAHNDLYGDRLLSWSAYGTVALSLGVAGGTLVASNSWLGAAISAVATFFTAGYFVSRFTTTLAVKRLCTIFHGHFEHFWDAQIVAVRFPSIGQELDSRVTNRWQDTVQALVGLAPASGRPTANFLG